ncbi:MAG: sulfotransferase domain-containing protein [Dongiaceae bacterium]
MAKVVWIASYPRSGNTWLRFLLASLIRREAIANSAQVQALIPDIHEGVAGIHLWGKRTTLIKTHWAFSPDLPLREDTAGVIQLVRHPIDTLESNQNYAMNRAGERHERATPEERARHAAEFADNFIRDGGHRQFAQFGIGALEQHILSWSSSTLTFPRLVVRYEDLKADPAGELARICHFIRMRRSGEEIADAIDRAAAARMRQLEDAEIAGKVEGLFYQIRNRSSLESGHRFVGRSSSGETKYRLSDLQRERAGSKFADLICLLGYQTGRKPAGGGSPAVRTIPRSPDRWCAGGNSP